MYSLRRNILCVFLFLYLGITNSYANHTNKTNVVEKILPSVVEVISDKDIKRLDTFNNQPQNRGGFQFRNRPQQNPNVPQRRNNNDPKEEPTHLGSGFVVSPEGHIITNAHVINNCISNCKKITIVFSNEVSYEASLINYDEDSDIALLKIINTDDRFKYLVWGDKPELGEDVIAIGSPMNQSFSVTFGNVSSLDRFIPKAASFVPFIQTDTAINPGNSGGPLLNTKGEVVGVISMIISTGDGKGSIGIGFAIDGTFAQTVIEKLYLGKQIKRPFLGIVYRPLESDDLFDGHVPIKHGYGAYIQEVIKDSPSFGILKEGDIVLKVDGEEIKWRMLASIVKMKTIGEQIKFDILRDRKFVPIEMTLKGKSA